MKIFLPIIQLDGGLTIIRNSGHTAYLQAARKRKCAPVIVNYKVSMFPGFLLVILGIFAVVFFPAIALILLAGLATTRWRIHSRRALIWGACSGFALLGAVGAASLVLGPPGSTFIYPAAFAAGYTFGALCSAFSFLRHNRGNSYDDSPNLPDPGLPPVLPASLDQKVMNTSIRSLTMRLALRAAAEGKLEDGWLYLPSDENPGLDTACLMVIADSGEDIQSIASGRGFPVEGLDASTIEGTVHAARQFQRSPSDELLLESFTYYWRFDAWLPMPDAPEPPPWEETKLKLDREFFDSLGIERQDEPCRTDGCQRGAIQYSVFCRAHHFEMIRKEPCPFPE